MQIVVDANPIISLLIHPGSVAELLFLDELQLFAPQLLFDEIERNKDEIIVKSRLDAEEINQFLDIMKRQIKIIPERVFVSYRDEADKICPDNKDATYFALALYLCCPLWSNDKKLKEQLSVKVYATHELMRILDF